MHTSISTLHASNRAVSLKNREGKVFWFLKFTSEIHTLAGVLVCLVQKRLKALGYADFDADGVFGPLTRSAVEMYQRDKGCAVTGKLDEATWNCLLEKGESK